MGDHFFPRLAEPDGAPAVRIGGQTLTYRQLAGAAARVAQQVAGQERVALWAASELETCVAAVGALAAGVAVVPLNPKSGPRELEHIVADSRPGFVLARTGTGLPAALAGVPRLNVERRGDGGGSLPDRLAAGQTAFVLYTSGTTGPPKGVLIPRRAIVTNLDAVASVWEWTGADVLAHALPLFHVHGLVLGVLGPLRLGGCAVVEPRFTPGGLARALEDGATMVFGVPTMYHRIAAEAAADPELARAYAGARLLVSGSAALPAADHERMARHTGQRLVERYGMTETLMSIGVRCGEPRRAGYVGRPFPGVEVRLLDETGSPLETSDDETIGELAIRGPNLFSGYLNRPDATAEAMRDGWFLTGDLATRAPDGNHRIVGRRATDLIKSGGWRIGAGEIEAALLEHPAVAEAAVAGLPDEDLGERVAAWVVLEPGAAASAGELAGHVASLLASHKSPREVHFVPALPRTPLGKVIKKALVQGAAALDG